MKKAETAAEALSYRAAMLVDELYVLVNGHAFYACPRCHITMDREFTAYCTCCGQKLGWNQYKKAKVIHVLPKKYSSSDKL